MSIFISIRLCRDVIGLQIRYGLAPGICAGCFIIILYYKLIKILMFTSFLFYQNIGFDFTVEKKTYLY